MTNQRKQLAKIAKFMISKAWEIDTEAGMIEAIQTAFDLDENEATDAYDKLEEMLYEFIEAAL